MKKEAGRNKHGCVSRKEAGEARVQASTCAVVNTGEVEGETLEKEKKEMCRKH